MLKSKKRIIALIMVTLTSTGLLSGCNKGPLGTKTAYASSLTIEEIKSKYGAEDTNAIMPMYNVEPNKEFEFKFNSDLGDVSGYDLVTVHTSSKCTEESEIGTLNWPTTEDDKTSISIKPMMAVLASESSYNGDGMTWGNAPIYYIRINYDMDSETPKKLDTPTIIPFTVKSELPVPNVKSEIDTEGNLKITWDKVEGAEKYNIYQVSKISFDAGNLPVSSADTGYKGFPRLEDTIEGTEWNSFMEGTNGGKISSFKLENGKDAVTVQNAGVMGDYYVTAVAGDKESNFSKPISTYPMSNQLPNELSDKLNISFFNDMSELPKTVKVKFIDDSIAEREVIYDTENVEVQFSGQANVCFSVKNTSLTGYVNVKNYDETKVPKNDTDETVGGFIETTNEIQDIPEPTVPTIIEKDNKNEDKKPAKEEDKKEPTKEEPVKEETKKDEATIEAQKENTKKIIEDAKKEEVKVPTVIKDYKINAETAFEEYLALKLYSGEEKISIAAFPEMQNAESLVDTLSKVMYQNPLIIGIEAYGYDYNNLELQIRYNISKEDTAKQQEEIITEAKKIVSEVIKSGMTDEEKRKALYDYLNDNTKYDDAALENAESNNYKEVDESFNDSFTTYGIMVKKVGVCMSYAYTYKMLCDLAEVECIVTTGTIQGIPHAWNKVKIDNEWNQTDNTNNETNVGIPYMLFESNDEVAKSLTYIEDKEYWIDGELSKFVSTTSKNDYYVANNLEVKTLGEYEEKLTKLIKDGKSTIVLRDVSDLSEDEIMEVTGKVLNTYAKDKIETAKFGKMAQYVVLMLE